jgi:hypothetical protein
MRKLIKAIRRFWYVKVCRHSPEFVDLWDYFANPDAPWNKR